MPPFPARLAASVTETGAIRLARPCLTLVIAASLAIAGCDSLSGHTPAFTASLTGGVNETHEGEASAGATSGILGSRFELNLHDDPDFFLLLSRGETSTPANGEYPVVDGPAFPRGGRFAGSVHIGQHPDQTSYGFTEGTVFIDACSPTELEGRIDAEAQTSDSTRTLRVEVAFTARRENMGQRARTPVDPCP